MIEFKEVEISDRPWVTKLLSYSDFRGCEYSFSTIFLWRFVHSTKISRIDDMLIVYSGSENTKSFLFPAGSGDLKAAITEMERTAEQKGQPFRMHSVNNENKQKLEQLFPGRYEYTLTRDYFDYVYDTQKLITLSGKKLHSKRNHVNRFLKENEGNWSFELISKENILECREMNKLWCVENDCIDSEGKLGELYAVSQAFQHYDELGLTGGLIRVNGEVVAFTMGEPLNSDTYHIHIEKGMSCVHGTYPMINQQFAKEVCSGYKYINREDDAGAEGLRKAKLSYKPVMFEKKYNVRLLP